MADKVLIVSANGMFRAGLLSLLETRQDSSQLEILQADSMPETLRLLTEVQPGLIVLDHDDQKIRKQEFLDFFVRSQFTVMVILISLLSSGSVVVYDRKNLQPDEITDFLQHTLSQERYSHIADRNISEVEEKK